MAERYQQFIGSPFYIHNVDEFTLSRRLSLEHLEPPQIDLPVTPAETDQDGLLKNASSYSNYGSVAEKGRKDGVTLSWRNLSVYAPRNTTTAKNTNSKQPPVHILNEVSGAIKPGALFAILGSSGAGKSTLLSALSLRMPRELQVEGDIYVNGRKVEKQMADLFGYVDQHDMFLACFTVKEHLTFMARMKMDKDEPKSSLKRKVTEVLNLFGLSSIQNTRIGTTDDRFSISGGERKRLSFATEVLTDPQLILCDEPTTGLDSYNAKKLVQILRGMAMGDKTILCTIHQPSTEIFHNFDGLLLLTEGRIAYLGPLRDALGFFDSLGHTCPPSFNPADFYIHTLAVRPGHEPQSFDRIKRICDAYEDSDFSRDAFAEIQHQTNQNLAYMDAKVSTEDGSSPPTYKKVTFWTQVYWLSWRALLHAFRDPLVYRIRLVQRIVMAFILGIIYMGTLTLDQEGIINIQGGITAIAMENLYPCMFAVLNVFPAEIPLFIREYKNGVYTSAPYYLSKAITMIPGFTLWAVEFVVISYWLFGLQSHAYQFFITLITCVMLTNVSSACGLMFSAIFEHRDTMLLVITLLTTTMFLNSGFTIKLKSIASWIKWTKYISWHFYGVEIMSVVQWEGVTNISCYHQSDTSCMDTGEKVLHEYGMRASAIGMDFLYMIFIYCVLHYLGYLGLRRRARKA